MSECQANSEARECLQRLIGSILDHPSVYMGGASHNSMRKADRVINALIREGYIVRDCVKDPRT